MSDGGVGGTLHAGIAEGAVLAEHGFKTNQGAFVEGAVAEDEVDFFVGGGGGEGAVESLVVVAGGAGGLECHQPGSVVVGDVEGDAHGGGLGFIGVEEHPASGDDLFGDEVFGVILGVEFAVVVVAECHELFLIFGGDEEAASAEAVGSGGRKFE